MKQKVRVIDEVGQEVHSALLNCLVYPTLMW